MAVFLPPCFRPALSSGTFFRHFFPALSSGALFRRFCPALSSGFLPPLASGYPAFRAGAHNAICNSSRGQQKTGSRNLIRTLALGRCEALSLSLFNSRESRDSPRFHPGSAILPTPPYFPPLYLSPRHSFTQSPPILYSLSIWDLPRFYILDLKETAFYYSVFFRRLDGI